MSERNLRGSVNVNREFEKTRTIAIGGLAVGAIACALMLPGGDEISKSEERATESCVAELVNHPVDLVPENDGSGLQHPASVLEEQVACERSDNDVAQAKISLQYKP